MLDSKVLTLYVLLGLIAFLAPRFVHEVKALLDFLDAISTMVYMLSLLQVFLRLRVEDAGSAVSPFVVDYLSATVCYFEDVV